MWACMRVSHPRGCSHGALSSVDFPFCNSEKVWEWWSEKDLLMALAESGKNCPWGCSRTLLTNKSPSPMGRNSSDGNFEALLQTEKKNPASFQSVLDFLSHVRKKKNQTNTKIQSMGQAFKEIEREHLSHGRRWEVGVRVPWNRAENILKVSPMRHRCTQRLRLTQQTATSARFQNTNLS